MNKFYLGAVITIAFVTVLAGNLSARLVGYRDLPNTPAPEIMLTSLENRLNSLKDYRGKFVLLSFWETYCPHCVKEFQSMESLAKRFKGSLAVVAVSSDPRKTSTIEALKEKLNLQTIQFKTVNSRKLTGAFDVSSVPTTFIIDPQGTIIGVIERAISWNSLGAMDFMENLIQQPLVVAQAR